MVLLVDHRVHSVVVVQHFSIGSVRCSGSSHLNRFCHQFHKLVQILADTFLRTLWTWMRPSNVSLEQHTCAFHNSLYAFDIQNDTIYYPNHIQMMVLPNRSPHYNLQSLHNFSMKLEQRGCHMSSLSFRIVFGKRFHLMHKLVQLHCHWPSIVQCIGIRWFLVLCKHQCEPS